MAGGIARDTGQRLRELLGGVAQILIQDARVESVATAHELGFVADEETAAVGVAERHVVFELIGALRHQAAVPPGKRHRRHLAAGRELEAHHRGARIGFELAGGLLAEGFEDGRDVAFDADRVTQVERHEGGIDDVATHVAERTGAEIPPGAPLAGVIRGVERTERRRPAPPIPVHAFGGFLRFGGTVHLAALRPDRTIRPGVHFADLADESGGDPLGDLTDAFAGMPLVAHLGHDLIFVGRLGEDAGFEDGMGDRLLDVDMLASAHALHGDVSVRMVGRGDDDRVDVLALVEHLAEVGEQRGLRELLDRPGAAAEVQVAERDDILVRGIPHVAAADAAETNGGDVQLPARRGRRSDGRSLTGRRLGGAAGDGHGRGGQAGLTKEGTTIELGCHGVGVMQVYESPAGSQVPCGRSPTCLAAQTPRTRSGPVDSDVNRSGGQAERPPYLAVWMNLMTGPTGLSWPKFRLTML